MHINAIFKMGKSVKNISRVLRKTNDDRTRDYLVSYIHGGNFKMVFYFVELLIP